MRITVDLDDALLEKAAKVTGVSDKATLVRLALQALIAKETAKRLAGLGRTEQGLEMIPRRRSA